MFDMKNPQNFYSFRKVKSYWLTFVMLILMVGFDERISSGNKTVTNYLSVVKEFKLISVLNW